MWKPNFQLKYINSSSKLEGIHRTVHVDIYTIIASEMTVSSPDPVDNNYTELDAEERKVRYTYLYC